MGTWGNNADNFDCCEKRNFLQLLAICWSCHSFAAALGVREVSNINTSWQNFCRHMSEDGLYQASFECVKVRAKPLFSLFKRLTPLYLTW